MMFYLKYFFALCYDAFIVCALFFAFTALCLLFRKGLAIPPSSTWYQLSLLMLYFLYYYLSVKYGGQTIGMRSWTFKLINSQKETLSLPQIFLRLVLFIPAALLAVFLLKNPARLLEQWSQTKLIHS